MAGKPSRCSPNAVIASTMCAEAMCASMSSWDSHSSTVTKVAGAEAEANSS
jgi:hypothetical protein